MTMGVVRDLWSDLVEKRLWPVALALVAALVAVPVLLAKSPSASAPAGGAPDSSLSAPAANGPAGAGGPARAGEPVVSIARAVSRGALRGHAKDPFKQQFPQAKTAGAGATPPAGAKAAPGGTGGSPGTSGGSTPSGGGAPPTTKKLYTVARIDVRFGRAAAPLREIANVPRLTPLPSADNPVVIFLGMRADEQTAVFMISSDVHAQGDGRCTPSKKHCDAIELQEGQTEILDVTGSDGSVTEYELDLDRVTIEHTTSQSEAHSALADDAAAAQTP
jgi:hypothetical protein